MSQAGTGGSAAKTAGFPWFRLGIGSLAAALGVVLLGSVAYVLVLGDGSDSMGMMAFQFMLVTGAFAVPALALGVCAFAIGLLVRSWKYLGDIAE